MSLMRALWSLALLISLNNAAYGDVPFIRHGPKQPIVAPVKIVEGKVDDLAPNVVARIVIPSSLLPDLQERSHVSPVSDESPLAGMTIVAGLALSACAISLLFAFKKSPYREHGMVGLIGCVLVVTLVLLANFFSPAKFIAPAGQSKLQPQIVIEVQKDGHEVLLVLPSRQ